MKKAIVIGATGLVGSNLVRLLLNDNDYNQVDSFSRKPLGIKHSKLIEHIVDFNNIAEWKNEITGNVLFSAMGTTLKKAYSKDAQYLIDYTYQYEFAKAASQNNVANYVLVSADMANKKSSIFYSRIKGELEEEVKKLPFKSIKILRPGLIYGNREDKRIVEKIMVPVLFVFSKIPGLSSLKPIKGSELAQALINADKSIQEPITTFSSSNIFKLLKKKSQ